VVDFLSDAWFESLNETLKHAKPIPGSKSDAVFRIVLEFANAPKSVNHALTFTIEGKRATVTPGDHFFADTLVRLSYADGNALFKGDFDSATALREGRIKVRGDINAMIPMLNWFQSSHPHASERPPEPEVTSEDQT
jgi:putative sterol carrier protein